jgi:hypothetical protein
MIALLVVNASLLPGARLWMKIAHDISVQQVS